MKQLRYKAAEQSRSDEAPAQQGGQANYAFLAAADPRRSGRRDGVTNPYNAGVGTAGHPFVIRSRRMCAAHPTKGNAMSKLLSALIAGLFAASAFAADAPAPAATPAKPAEAAQPATPAAPAEKPAARAKKKAVKHAEKQAATPATPATPATLAAPATK
jgi:hypothetical protein